MDNNCDSLSDPCSALPSRKPRRLYWIIGASFIVLLPVLLLLAVPRLGHSAQAGLQITLVSTNTVQVTITNGSPGDTFQIERRPAFDENYDWGNPVSGTLNQTNFLLTMGAADVMEFYRALSCLDCDGDGVPNTSDANPLDPAIGILTITIDNPANGSVVQ